MARSQIASIIKQNFPLPSLLDSVWGVFVILVSLAYHISGQLSLKETMPYTVCVYGLLTPFALSFFRTHSLTASFSLKTLAFILGFLFSQFVTIGYSFFIKHDWSLCFGNWQSILIWICQTLCYGYVFYKIILGIVSILQTFTLNAGNYSINPTKWFFIFLSVKLIYFAALYPCVFDIDAAIGLRTFLDLNSAICNHHPFFIQALHGITFIIGQSWGNPSWGFALLSLILICASSGILTYGILLLSQSNIGKKWTIGVAFVFAFVPLFSYLNLFITKDGFFSYSFLLYIFTLYELYLSKGECLQKIGFITLHILSVLLVCITRHQGIYLIILEFVLLIFCYKKFWIRISAITIPTLFLYFLYSNILLPYLNVEPGGKQEIYSTLFHQTSHYLQKYPEDITESEQKAIFSILDKDKITQNYRYNLTDGSKDCYKYNPMNVVSLGIPVVFHHVNRSTEAEELQAYRSAWLSMFLKHPLSYLQATMGVFSGFFYNNNDPLVKLEPHWTIARFAITPEYMFWHYDKFEKSYYLHAFRWASTPILSWFFAIPYYIWVAIITLSLLFYRKDLLGISIFLPVILSLGLLLICPYASGRYTFPIVIVLPLLIIYIISSNKKDKCQE